MWKEIAEVVRDTIFQEDEADKIDVFDLKVCTEHYSLICTLSDQIKVTTCFYASETTSAPTVK